MELKQKGKKYQISTPTNSVTEDKRNVGIKGYV